MEAKPAVNSAFLLLEDGTPADVAAFRQAILDDGAKMEQLERNNDLRALIDSDNETFQRLVKSVVEKERARLASCPDGVKPLLQRCVAAQRAAATVPRDTVHLYEQLRQTGLQYGPAFRLLRNVHVPDTQQSV